MTPLQHFDSIWERASHLSAVHAYLAANATLALRTDEVLRAEWAARVSALDLYIHELVAQRMLDVFERRRPACPAYLRYRLSTETLNRISAAVTPTDAAAAFDLDVREQLGAKTFQAPDDIAEGIRHCSPVELWNSVALHQGAPESRKQDFAKTIRRNLSFVVQRRNKIVHEGDLQPGIPRVPWPVSQADLTSVTTLIEGIVRSIHTVVG